VFWLSMWSCVCYFLLSKAFLAFKHAKIYLTFGTLISAFFSFIFALPFLFGEFVGLALLSSQSFLSVFCVTFMILMNVIFYFLMKAPTAEGRTLMDEIDGFRLYLSTTERFRLNQMNAPTQTAELFEK